MLRNSVCCMLSYDNQVTNTWTQESSHRESMRSESWCCHFKGEAKLSRRNGVANPVCIPIRWWLSSQARSQVSQRGTDQTMEPSPAYRNRSLTRVRSKKKAERERTCADRTDGPRATLATQNTQTKNTRTGHEASRASTGSLLP